MEQINLKNFIEKLNKINTLKSMWMYLLWRFNNNGTNQLLG